VSQTKVQDVDELHHGITAACETVTPVMLQHTLREVEYRLDICAAAKETHRGASKLVNFLHLSVKFPYLCLC
jgi:hypothetical protein